MSEKQFPYDSATDVVLPALKALARANTNVSLLERDRVIFRSPDTYHSTTTTTTTKTPEIKKKVTLISGGGSGHEPTHAGFVGKGLLDAAVCGSVFASPSTKQVIAGLTAVDPHSLGSLVVVKNYTGDVINFGLAAERFKTQKLKQQNKENTSSSSSSSSSSPVRLVVVQDDVAVGRKKGGLVGRRGLAGTLLVHKIAGAAAERSSTSPEVYTLDTIADIAQAVIDNTVTVGCSLDHCNVPGRPFQTNLSSNEMEIGMGIHNEPGALKLEKIPSVSELIESELLGLLLDQSDSDRAFVPFDKNSEESILLVNNLGGLSILELHYIAEVTLNALRKKYGITPVRVAIGTYITALNGPGFSLTLLNASRASDSSSSKDTIASVVDLFDDPASSLGWNLVPFVSARAKDLASTGEYSSAPDPLLHKEPNHSGISVPSAKDFSDILAKGLSSVVSKEPQITRYDTVAGDGDCGETLVAGALGIIGALGRSPESIGLPPSSESSKYEPLRLDDAVDAIVDIAEIVEDSMGGTSGGLYAIFLSALAQGLQKAAAAASASSSKPIPLSVDLFAAACPFALESLQKYTRANIGDRTLMDVLIPFIKTLSSSSSSSSSSSPIEIFETSVKSAINGAESTRKLIPKFGRASYVAQSELDQFKNEGGLPDPGAVGLAALLSGFLQGYKEKYSSK